MKINVRLEGGAGDHILGARFIPAIKEKYPNAKITAFCDTNGNTFQKEALHAAFNYLFEDIQVIPAKKYKEFWIDCQFGEDNYLGALENVPDEWVAKMMNADKFYDLHIDSLKWMGYDFDWLRYFYFFPKVDLLTSHKYTLPKEYVVLHLTSETSVGHRLEQWYVEKLITEISKFTHCVIISTPKTNVFYEGVKHYENVTIINDSMASVFSIISNARAMVSTDSGFRYIAHACSVPVLTFSANSPGPHQAIPSHQVRWLLFPQNVFPLNHNANYIAGVVKRILTDKGYSLLSYINDLDIQLVRRKYKANEQKTVCW